MMLNVGFFIPIRKMENNKEIKLAWLGRIVEGYFDAGQEGLRVIYKETTPSSSSTDSSTSRNFTLIALEEDYETCSDYKRSYLSTLKKLSYLTLVLPLLMILGKWIYRYSNHFEQFYPCDSRPNLDPTSPHLLDPTPSRYLSFSSEAETKETSNLNPKHNWLSQIQNSIGRLIKYFHWSSAPEITDQVPKNENTSNDFQYHGLHNSGNTCFMNAAIQLLINTKFLDDINNYDRRLQKLKKELNLPEEEELTQDLINEPNKITKDKKPEEIKRIEYAITSFKMNETFITNLQKVLKSYYNQDAELKQNLQAFRKCLYDIKLFTSKTSQEDVAELITFFLTAINDHSITTAYTRTGEDPTGCTRSTVTTSNSTPMWRIRKREMNPSFFC